jgi:hypothetical protein
MLRDTARSFGVNWGTSEPYCVEDTTYRKVGFAGDYVVEIVICAKTSEGFAPIIRQLAYRELESQGIDSDILEFYPTVGASRKQVLFVDCNESSPTLGKRKRGYRYSWHLRIDPAAAGRLFVWDQPRWGYGLPKPHPDE